MKAGVTSQPSGPWRKLRAARRSRELLAELPTGAVPRDDAARRFWSMRTWSEYAAIPAVAQVVLAMTRAGAPLEVLGTYTAIADDESRHALLSRQLAVKLGGYVDEVPEGLDYAPRSLARPSDVPAHVWAVANGCFSETVSLALIRARFQATKQPVVRAVLAETLKDEAVHVRVGWEVVSTLVPKLAQRDRDELRAYSRDLAEMIRRSFGTLGLPPAVTRRERRLRDRTAEAGLGALTADEENVIVEDTLRDIAVRLGRVLGP